MTKRIGFYNPFTYQPMMQAFYMGKPMPPEVSAVAAQNPQAANHINSVWQFWQWLNQTNPEVYGNVMERAPDLVDAGNVVLSGRLNVPLVSAGDPPSVAGTVAGMRGVGLGVGEPDGIAAETPATDWGKTVSDFLGKYLVYDQQKKLIDLNIKRAEQGLPPINAEQYAAGVQFGVTPGVQTLAYVALGGLVIVGLLGAMRRR